MEKFLIYFCDSLTIWIAAYITGMLLLHKHGKSGLITIIITIVFSLIISGLSLLNFEAYYGVIKVLTVYVLECLFYKIVFNASMSKSMVLALLYYLCMFVGEIIIAIVVSLITKVLGTSMQFTKFNLIMNLLIALINCVIVYIFRDRFKTFLSNNIKESKSYIGISTIILITLSLLVFRIPFTKWSFNMEFIITMLTLLSFVIIAIYLLKQKSDIEKTSNMYHEQVEYSKTTNKLLEDYRMVNHEHKNQLSVIRQMANKNNKKLIEYLDNLLDNKTITKYQWISRLNDLPLEGLKGLLNYKLVEMENSEITPIVNISKDVSKLKLGKLQTKQMDNLYSIVGVYLDNAIEASCESKQKKITLDIYKEKNILVMILGNTYKGKIDLDKMDEYGYTTKGKNHGIGLRIVRSILNDNQIFLVKRYLIDEYYVQELKIDLTGVNKKKKTTK